MKPYEGTQQYCKYGHFNLEKPASYTLTNGEELKGSWFYVYQNRKILLYVDQNGPVKIQYQPPSGILISKREIGETQSKWQVWVQSPKLNSGMPISNFNSPVLKFDGEKPEFTVEWTPAKAIYTSKYEKVDVITEIFVPCDKATVCMKTTIRNKTDEDMPFTVTPSIFPYVNKPQMVAWDLPEWYLSTKTVLNGKALTFAGQMNCPEMIATNNRSVTVNFDYDENAEFELNMSEYTLSGNFFAPASVLKDLPMTHKMQEGKNGVKFGGRQAVYAAKYKVNIAAGESKTFTQVVTAQEDLSYNGEENAYEQCYFEEEAYFEYVKKTDKFYEELFSKRKIKTSNPLLDNFINTFTPLQMYWVCSLDRGWPSSMRGIRDASQDFIGMLHLDEAWTRTIIMEMFEHQRMDGWMPRQISTISREAPHDMRYYCDGGAFLLELIHEYMTFTRDDSLLSEKVYWLDSDEKNTVLEHILKTVDFYLDEKNIGEHGLCKVWYGDWWDPMDKIGTDGRGETVTVTAQTVLNLKNLADMFRWLVEKGVLEERYLQLAESYMQARKCFIENMHKHAYNSLGYFNGYFNDNGKWLLSDNDPDGEDRMYLVSNAWSIIGGVADEKMTKSVLENAEKRCYCGVAYNTQSKAYSVRVDKAGRVGNGTSPEGTSYNHAQSFLVRACCVANNAEMAYKVSRYIYPIEEAYAPTEKTVAPPYAIVNCYANSDKRAGFQFLSGTVSYVLRTFYSFFFGITFEYDGLTVRSCMPKEFGDCSAEFTYLGKKFALRYTQNGQKEVRLNGKPWTKTKASQENEKKYPFIADSDMQEENSIEIYY